MNTLLSAILILCAFILGSCPFSVWIGHVAIHTDIRNFGDGNPGSTNVFRAGSRKWGIVALAADVMKGIPFILMAEYLFGLTQPVLFMVAYASILGHAYSPFLNFRGGKALAVFGGTLLGLQQWDTVMCMTIFLILGFLLIGNDSLTTMMAVAGTLIGLTVMRAEMWELMFIAGVAALFLIKHYRDLRRQNTPGRLANWVRARRKDQ